MVCIKETSPHTPGDPGAVPTHDQEIFLPGIRTIWPLPYFLQSQWGQSHFFLLKYTTIVIPISTRTSQSTGYAHGHPNSGMCLKFIP